MKNILDQKGQSLIEVVIALSLAVVVIIAFSNVTISSIRNAQFAKNQNQATKYTQEAIEIIRAIRDQDAAGSVITNSTNPSTTNWSTLWQVNLSASSAPLNDTGQSYTGRCYSLNKETFVLTENTGTSCRDVADPAVGTEGIFKRKINITDVTATYSTKKTITVSTYWTDSSGRHTSTVTTELGNWQNL